MRQFNWTELELIAYEQEIKRIWDNRAVEEYKLEQAEAKGIEKGIEKVAISMIKQKLNDALIKQATGLSQDDIAKLKNKIN